jgi:hypothetical protein
VKTHVRRNEALERLGCAIEQSDTLLRQYAVDQVFLVDIEGYLPPALKLEESGAR